MQWREWYFQRQSSDGGHINWDLFRILDLTTEKLWKIANPHESLFTSWFLVRTCTSCRCLCGHLDCGWWTVDVNLFIVNVCFFMRHLHVNLLHDDWTNLPLGVLVFFSANDNLCLLKQYSVLSVQHQNIDVCSWITSLRSGMYAEKTLACRNVKVVSVRIFAVVVVLWDTLFKVCSRIQKAF